MLHARKDNVRVGAETDSWTGCCCVEREGGSKDAQLTTKATHGSFTWSQDTKSTKGA